MKKGQAYSRKREKIYQAVNEGILEARKTPGLIRNDEDLASFLAGWLTNQVTLNSQKKMFTLALGQN